MADYYKQNEIGWDGTGTTGYYAAGKKALPEYGGEQADPDNRVYPKAFVEVRHGKHTPNFEFGNSNISQSYFDHFRRMTDDYDTKNVEIDLEYPPETLFTEHLPTVTHAFTHTSLRHTVPTLLALAQKEHGKMVASNDLSPHSSRIAKKAMNRGLAEGHENNPFGDVSNSIGFDDRLNIVHASDLKHGLEKVPENDIRAAKGALRRILRPQKEYTDHMESQQFDHLKLPGMENL